MLIEQLLAEAKVNVLNREIDELIAKQKASIGDEAEPMSSEETQRLKTLRHIKKNDIWETSGSKVPGNGPSLSTRLSAHRELVLFKNSSGKIAVVQCAESGGSTEDRTLAVFANSETGYNKALNFYISRTSR